MGVGQYLLTLSAMWKRCYPDPKHLAKAALTVFTQSLPVIQASLYCVFVYFLVRKFLLYWHNLS